MNTWWQDEVIYQIYPRSFQDTDGDGIGDIKGIISRLPKLKALGVGIIWLCPMYVTPGEDNGYDIEDYLAIDPLFGSMADMDNLIKEANESGIRIIMDIAFNHTSVAHKWFVESRKRNGKYTDYYYWKPAKENGKLPNNWTGFFGGDVWEYDGVRKEYYLHLFAKGMADLNLGNKDVCKEIDEILKFWLDKGIAGFRLDVINIIGKESLEDGKPRLILTGSEHYISREKTHQLLRHFNKEVFSKYDCFTVGETVFVTPSMALDLVDPKRKEIDSVLSFQHMECDQFIVKWFKTKFKPRKLFKTLKIWQKELAWNINYFENHDQPRNVSRFGSVEYWEKSAKLLATLLLTLKGTPIIYQGQEIGMTNFDFTDIKQVMDVESLNIYQLATKLHFTKGYRWKMIKRTSRDNARTPMQWSNTKNAGFTKGKPWLGINQNYQTINYSDQEKDKDSVLNYYKKVIALRKNNDILRCGEFTPVFDNKQLFVFARYIEDERILVLLNFSKKPVLYKAKGQLLLSNYDINSYEGALAPYQAVILRESL